MVSDHLFTSVILLASIHFAAMVSPGPTAILVLKTGAQKINKEICFLVVGIVCATLTNVILTITGVATLIATSKHLAIGLSVFGAIYLSYLGKV
ncbi:MAG: LysE family transporter [Candidatus Zeuxoniibacter abyssi]|nr:MAG: LysE family transporter [Candidatus Persebacteraceae bacterium AB1(2)]